MKPRLVRANPLVREDAGRVALERGPLVYCLEQPDQLGFNLFDASLLDDGSQFKSDFNRICWAVFCYSNTRARSWTILSAASRSTGHSWNMWNARESGDVELYSLLCLGQSRDRPHGGLGPLRIARRGVTAQASEKLLPGPGIGRPAILARSHPRRPHAKRRLCARMPPSATRRTSGFACSRSSLRASRRRSHAWGARSHPFTPTWVPNKIITSTASRYGNTAPTSARAAMSLPRRIPAAALVRWPRRLRARRSLRAPSTSPRRRPKILRPASKDSPPSDGYGKEPLCADGWRG